MKPDSTYIIQPDLKYSIIDTITGSQIKDIYYANKKLLEVQGNSSATFWIIVAGLLCIVLFGIYKYCEFKKYRMKLLTDYAVEHGFENGKIKDFANALNGEFVCTQESSPSQEKTENGGTNGAASNSSE